MAQESKGIRWQSEKRNDLDFWVLVRSFLHEYMPKVRAMSTQSVAAYKQSLNSYLEFLGKSLNIRNEGVCFDTFSRDNIKKYLAWMQQTKQYAPKTINLRLTAIKTFLNYGADEDIALRGLYTSVCSLRGPKISKSPINFLSPEAMKSILAATDATTAIHRRNRMLLILMYDSGARIQELSDLFVSSLHLNVDNPFLTLVGKGRKTRNVPLMKKTICHLYEYLKEFHSYAEDKPLFYTKSHGLLNKLSVDSIGLALKKAAAKAKEECEEGPETVYCHLVRKTRAMDLYQHGIPLQIVARVFGHENVSTTSGFYAFATLKMMYDAMEKSISVIASGEKVWKLPEFKKMLYSLDYTKTLCRSF